MLKRLSPTATYMLLSVAALFVLFGVLGALLILFVYPIEPMRGYLLGLLLGCLVTALRVVMMDSAIRKEVDMSESRAKHYHQLMFFLRYGLLIAFAVTLILCNDTFGVYGGVIGILCLQLSAYCANRLLRRHEKKHPRKQGGNTISFPPPTQQRRLFDQDQE